jgi:hypothetical protein
MAYQVDRFNGTFLVSVEDGTIDTTTDLRLVGKNYAGYGELQNENFLHILENFSNTTAPPKAITGQIWYDSGNKKLKFYDGLRFKAANGAELGTVAPPGLQTGEFWFDTSAEQLYTWNGVEFVLIGPEAPPNLGASAVVSEVVKDTLGNNHSIAKLQSAGVVIAIISKDEFTLNSVDNPITGFSVIKKGFTLVNTDGVSGVTSDDHYYWGTSSNSLSLGGFSANDFIRSSNAAFNQEVSFPDAGFSVGDQNDLRVRVENGDETVIENRLGNLITLRIRLSDSDQRNVANFTSEAILPGISEFYNLGSTVNKWQAVHSVEFYGNIVGDVTGNLTGSHKGNILASDNTVAYNSNSKTFFGSIGDANDLALLTGNVIGNVTGNSTNSLALNGLVGDQGAVSTTVALRDSNANLTANRFIGIADKADRIKINNTASDSDPNYKTAKTIAAATSIAARDGSGNLIANVFQGTATAARYADLAEKYLADDAYDTGTVVVVGGVAEVTASAYGDRAIGVVSANPAYMMNSELAGGTYIALKGRVPVKVYGSVKKGDKLVAYDQGAAIVASLSGVDVFAVALENNDSLEIKLVESVIL